VSSFGTTGTIHDPESPKINKLVETRIERNTVTFKPAILDTSLLNKMGKIYTTLTVISRWTFNIAGPVNLSSPFLDLIQVLSLLKVEKLLSALAVLTGKVRSMVNKVWIKGYALSSYAAKRVATV